MSAGGRAAGALRDWALLCGAFALAALLAFAFRGALAEALALYPQATAPGAAPRDLLAAHPLLLGLRVPLATLGTGLLCLAPGLLVAALAGPAGRDEPGDWLLRGLLVSLPLLCGAAALGDAATGGILRGAGFLALPAGLSLLLLPFVLGRIARGEGPSVRLAGRGTECGFALLLPLLLLVLFLPKFLWESFTPDGSGGLQFTRLLVATAWPFWPPEAGEVAKAPGITSFLFALPNSWMLRAIGEWEFAVRAPMLVTLGLLHPLLVAMMRGEREGEGPGPVAQGLLAAVLGLYAFTEIWSGGYHPWFNDSPMPAVREALAALFLLGTVRALLSGRAGLFLASGLALHLTVPSGGLWLVLLPLGLILARAPLPPRMLGAAAFTLLAAALVSLLAPPVFRLAGLPYDGGEFGLRSIVERLRFVAPAFWERLPFLLVPGAIVPALALLLWPRHERAARGVALALAAFFLFFALQGYRVLLHHFATVALLPLPFFWRAFVRGVPRPALAQGLLAAGIALALWAGWPRETGLHPADRLIGQDLATEGPAFAVAAPAPGERFRGFSPEALDIVHDLMIAAFPIGWTDAAPETMFYGGPHVWFFYSEFPKPEGVRPNLLIRPLDPPGPPGMPGTTVTPGEGTLLAESGGYGLYVRDMARLEAQRTQRLPFDTGAPILATPRDALFGRGVRTEGRIVIDLVGLARPFLEALGLGPPPAP